MRVCIVPNDIELRNQLSGSLIVICTVKREDEEVDVCSKQDLIDKGYDLGLLNLEEFDYTPTEEPA